MLRYLTLAAIWIASTGAAFAQTQSLPAESLRKLKAASVYVKVTIGKFGGSGSGFLMKADANSGLIVTNDHVIEPGILRILGIADRPVIDVVFESGQPNEWTARAEVIGRDPERDLALLRVKALKPLAEPLTISDDVALQETMSVYVCGFPFGELLSAGARNPEISIGIASVSSIRKDDRGQLAAVQLNGALNPGNSGGPVVTPDGKLVGVAVKTVRAAGIGIAIPATFVKDLVVGRVCEPMLSQSKAFALLKRMQIEVWTSDPNNRVASVSVYVAPSGFEKPPSDVSKMPNAEIRFLSQSKDATPLFNNTMAMPDATHVWMQTAWKDKDNVQRFSQVRKVRILTVADFELLEKLAMLDDEESLPAPPPPKPAPQTPPPQPAPHPVVPEPMRPKPPGIPPDLPPRAYVPPPAPAPDKGIIGLVVAPTGTRLPPIATRLPPLPPGQISMLDVDSRYQEFVGKEVTVDLICAVNSDPKGALPLAFSRTKNGEMREILSITTAKSIGDSMRQFAGKEMAVRARGKIWPSASGNGHKFSIDEIGLIAIDGTVPHRFKRAEAPATSTNPISLRAFAEKLDRSVGTTLSNAPIYMTGISDEIVQTSLGQRTLKRLRFTENDTTASNLRVYVHEDLAARLEEKWKSENRPRIAARISILANRSDLTLKTLNCSTMHISLYDETRKQFIWRGDGLEIDSLRTAAPADVILPAKVVDPLPQPTPEVAVANPQFVVESGKSVLEIFGIVVAVMMAIGLGYGVYHFNKPKKSVRRSRRN